ncbi:MAG: YicC/YloC family endoribonuclease [Bacteroidales bacterium]
MLISMTGYGKAEVEFGSKKIIAEIRSLNSKQLDLSVKLPSIYREVEMDIRTAVSQQLVRGKVDFQITYEDSTDSSAIPINNDVFASYYNQLQQLSSKHGISLNEEPIFQTILRLPDVLKVQKSETSEEEWSAIRSVIDKVLTQINSFRTQEGTVLEKDIVMRVNTILDLLDKVEPFEKQRITDIRARLSDNLAGLSKDLKIDSDRFEQEIIYYLEKLDVTEEKVRLRNHCKYFIDTVKLEEPVGRKLGFIAQEMGREINTLGSKANNADIQKLVVMMKDELEKIKEQSLNIL